MPPRRLAAHVSHNDPLLACEGSSDKIPVCLYFPIGSCFCNLEALHQWSFCRYTLLHVSIPAFQTHALKINLTRSLHQISVISKSLFYILVMIIVAQSPSSTAIGHCWLVRQWVSTLR